jgi:hypothetical protein
MTDCGSGHNAMSLHELKVELFCYHLLDGLSIADAYYAVGYAPDSKNSWRYYHQQNVQDRLKGLRDEIKKHALASATTTLSNDTLREFLMDNAVESRAQGDYAPSNRAIELLGRDQGMWGTAPVHRHLAVSSNKDVTHQATVATSWLEEVGSNLGTDSVSELVKCLRSAGPQRLGGDRGEPHYFDR